MIALDVAATTVPALARTGLLKPVAPRAMYRVAKTLRRHGSNPATVLGIAAARWPNRTAVIDDEGAATYGELYTSTESLAATLSDDYGLGPGDAVGVLCRNGRRFLHGVFAASAIGADVVLLNTDFSAHVLAKTIAAHRISVIVCDDEYDETLRAAGATPVGDQRVTRRRPHNHPSHAGRIIVLTSGTTGTPKGVPRSPKVSPILGIAGSILERTRLRAGGRIVIAVPLFHAFGFAIVMLGATLGATLILRRRFDAEAALAQASIQRADAVAVVPIMLRRILDLPEDVRARNPVRSLRVVISGAAPLDPTLARDFMDAFGDILYNGYGSSEVGIGTFAVPADLRAAPGTVGKPVAGAPVRILDTAGRPVAANVVGRIFVGGGMTFDGYTTGGAKAIVANLMSTGDMGYLDHAGRLFIVGREDDMIISGGENVYPQAVENALARHPDVADNAVVGVPDEQYGQRLAAFVVLRGGNVDTLRTYLKANVSRFEQPRDIHVVSEIPRNPSGKILRRELI